MNKQAGIGQGQAGFIFVESTFGYVAWIITFNINEIISFLLFSQEILKESRQGLGNKWNDLNFNTVHYTHFCKEKNKKHACIRCEAQRKATPLPHPVMWSSVNKENNQQRDNYFSIDVDVRMELHGSGIRTCNDKLITKSMFLYLWCPGRQNIKAQT